MPSDDIPLVDAEDLAVAEETKTKTRRTPAAKRAPASAPWKSGAISSFATSGYRSAASLMRVWGWADWAAICDEIAEPAGNAWEKVAKRNEAVKRLFDRLMQTGEFSELLWAHFPLFVFAAGKAGVFQRVMTDGVGAEFNTALAEEMRSANGTGPTVVNTAHGRPPGTGQAA